MTMPERKQLTLAMPSTGRLKRKVKKKQTLKKKRFSHKHRPNAMNFARRNWKVALHDVATAAIALLLVVG
jgi:hypothetical protein